MIYSKNLLLTCIAFFAINTANAGYGTGFFVSTNGFIITNAHVIEKATKIEVTNKKGSTFQARVIQVDDANDLALIKIESPSSPLKLTTSLEVEKGEKVYTLGFPSPQLQGYEAKYTEGVISSFSGIVGIPNTYQITTPIQPGNSGGPLVNSKGEFVGIIVSKLNSDNVQASFDFRPESVSYAVKSEYALSLLRLVPEAQRAGKSTPAKTVAQVEDSVVLIRTTAPRKESVASAPTVNIPPQNPTPRPPQINNRRTNVVSIAPDIAENGCVVPVGFTFSPALPINSSVEIFASNNLVATIRSLRSEITEFQFRARMTGSGAVTAKCDGCSVQPKQVEVRLPCNGDANINGNGIARIRVADQFFRALLSGNLPNSEYVISDANNMIQINSTPFTVINPFIGVKTNSGFSPRTCILVSTPGGQIRQNSCGE